ncbi:Pyruvate phosphate dikinase [Paratrimastix pyriformis]|uniref:Pyruvate, phosphate dikinase n=1 Tax=Paratrimastix pyriformis TaxID=342808 RepID=A0SNX6_9EUKA|nr:pyruvate phosphate dikinase [Paratrimastix pyriformis]KAJ4458635.1 Pyruvate phosphate dikinase [Paratrimastix pyriformis]|eukprot:GAFH01000806.1.p1 GENE.GAFH01000806.1~~GAFH01000806.1.p1  ORF type:complete len:887 (+),score=393.98 GAFH01000806.1:27-2663(+)
MAARYVFLFGTHPTSSKDILGGKGAGLAQMTKIGLPVPHGFTITTEACGEQWPEGLEAEISQRLVELEAQTGKKFGDAANPLLVSVRSGAAVSMPGMMDTVLNLGLNDTTIEGLKQKTNNPRFAYDSYRRFICMFGNVVMNIQHDKFEHILADIKRKYTRHFDCDLTAEELQEVIREFKALYERETKAPFPMAVMDQLKHAVSAVFSSWNNPRAIYYRKINDIRGLKGTAVTVQEMVFGNTGPRSGTGVGFTRNPSTGEKMPYGEYLVNAQGEDVVAGIRTPNPIPQMERDLPEAFGQLMNVYRVLEEHYKEMQDFEFTIEDGKLYMLQTRTGKRTAHAAVRIAKEMVEEGLITKEEALMRIDPNSLTQLLFPQLVEADKKTKRLLCKGLPASPGAARGKLAFSAEEAIARTHAGEKIILAREETCPDDIEGMNVSQGIVTARGGMTSHAAVVARGMGKCCITGAHDLHIDVANKRITLPDGTHLGNTDIVTLDGGSGEVFLGEVAIQDARVEGAFATIMEWANEIKRLGVRANAETPRDARKAREFGCEGVGLARTEHMFFQGERIWPMREMIIAETVEAREAALAKLLPYQKEDFKAILDIMDGLPVNIRLLDPPLHEFLPTEEKDQIQMAEVMHITVEQVKQLVDNMHEANPMLGFRGCRLGVVYPEINRMQVKAIFEAACELKAEKPAANMHVEVMIPVLAHEVEMKLMRELCVEEAEKVMAAHNIKIPYTVGVMMELPRACLMADHIAKHAEFFSFGTNDLTQTTLGYSRDDAAKFIKKYLERNVYEKDPFQVLDQEGVGQLIRMSLQRGRATRPHLKCGICGEHGGEPSSVAFCHNVGLNYVSCSPFRVPVARLAAARAAIQGKGKAPEVAL